MAERADQILLVEGKDDQHVIWALLEYHGVAKVFKVHERGGVERLLESLPVQIKVSRSRTVGIVVDADHDLLSRWKSICSILNSLGYANIPENPPPTGLITTHPHQPAFGAWIMPDNGLNGKLTENWRISCASSFHPRTGCGFSSPTCCHACHPTSGSSPTRIISRPSCTRGLRSKRVLACRWDNPSRPGCSIPKPRSRARLSGGSGVYFQARRPE